MIALLVGLLCFLFWHWLSGKMRWSTGHAIGWACVTAVVIGAGVDAWNMFYLGIARLESPLYARIALQGIHDVENLGTRVVMQVLGALAGTVLGWWWFSHRRARPPASGDDA